MSGIRLIVGLGNPGAQYENTRHNAGAWFVEQLAQAHHVTLRSEKKFQGSHAVVQTDGVELHLFIPGSYMNLSGTPLTAIAKFYKIPQQQILIAHDEIDLPAGVARLKFDGGHGGHNGLRDIFEKSASKQFYRLRIGVGHPGNSDDVVDYVLASPNKSDKAKIQQALQDAEAVTPLILAGQFEKAMHSLHSEKK